MKPSRIQVGDVVVPADGSKYRGEITYIDKAKDVVRHRCLATGREYEKSYFGFFCRYMTEQEAADAQSDDASDLSPPVQS